MLIIKEKKNDTELALKVTEITLAKLISRVFYLLKEMEDLRNVLHTC